jgi:hypothetical protein
MRLMIFDLAQVEAPTPLSLTGLFSRILITGVQDEPKYD